MILICGRSVLLRAALLVRPGVIVVDEVADPSLGPDDVARRGRRRRPVRLGRQRVSRHVDRPRAIRGYWATRSSASSMPSANGCRASASASSSYRAEHPVFSLRRMRAWSIILVLTPTSVGMNRPGGLADKVVVPSPFAWKVDLEPATDLVCIEPLTVVETALSRLPGPLPASALVVGAGAQGLLMCLALLRRGVDVHAIDLNPDRVALAAKLGAEAASADEWRPAIRPGHRLAGTPESMQTALDRIDTWGTLVVLGHRQPTVRDLVGRTRSPTAHPSRVTHLRPSDGLPSRHRPRPGGTRVARSGHD